ncbi:polyketide synthase [Xylariaceae sp. FL1272]|nr:polyketide synthase [Xylariaceae sp. FL1272]
MSVMEIIYFDDLVACVLRAIYGGNYQPGPTNDEPGDDTQSHDGRVFYDGSDTEEFIEASDGTSCRQELPLADILAVFEEVKWSTDRRISDAALQYTDSVIVAKSDRLCVALVVEAFQELGCFLNTATDGQLLTRIPHAAEHSCLMDWLYEFLHKVARLIDINNDGKMHRTHVSTPRRSSRELFNELMKVPDAWTHAHQLVYYAASNLADVLRGAKDGITLLSGSVQGRELVQGLYCDLPFNRVAFEQMRDVISEVGAGTGGTTRLLVRLLTDLGISVEDTFTDISPSMIARARKSFEAHSFVRYTVHDIEKPASNAIHATHNLHTSLVNLREALREDGFLMMTEMMESLPFTDLTFGFLERWWLLDNGRRHTLVSETKPLTKWESDLLVAGFWHVDWTDGVLDENRIQRVIIATVSGSDVAMTQEPPSTSTPVICLNRRNAHTAPIDRQLETFSSKGIDIPSRSLQKVTVFQTDISKPRLGLPDEQCEVINQRMTHIVHNAWPMSGSRVLHAFEPQFAAMRNFIDLATSATHHVAGGQGVVTFQFVSSISVVGHYDSDTDLSSAEIPEQRMPMSAVLPLGQIAGSRVSGYWNPVEHLPFLIKSSESLGALPALRGRQQWVAVEDVAGTMVDLLQRRQGDDVYPVYHIDNPVGQPGEDMVELLAEELCIDRILPFADWVRMVRRSPLVRETENPVVQLIQFVSRDFERMSCGGIVMETTRTREHSATLAAVGPIPDDVTR